MMAYVINRKFVLSHCVVLLCAIGLLVNCEDRTMVDLDPNRLLTIELLKQFVSNEAVPMTKDNIKYVSQYVQLLFEVLQDDDEHQFQSALAPTPPTPIISTIKGVFRMYILITYVSR